MSKLMVLVVAAVAASLALSSVNGKPREIKHAFISILCRHSLAIPQI